MPVATFPIGPLGTNSYIINQSQLAAAIDVGGDPAPMLDYLQKNNLELTAICITHRHFDHQYGVADLADATGAPIYAPQKDEVLVEHESSRGGIWGMPPVRTFPAQFLQAGKTEIAGMPCVVIDTPGHTPGGISLYFPEQNCVFTGDALFNHSIGRTDFYLGNHAQLLQSVRENLFSLPPDTIVYPGHGPTTTIGEEKRDNPFCGDGTI